MDYCYGPGGQSIESACSQVYIDAVITKLGIPARGTVTMDQGKKNI